MKPKLSRLTSIEDLWFLETNFQTDNKIDVHLIDYGDYMRMGLCFSVNTYQLSLEYTIEDSRGMIGSVIPEIQQNALLWKNRGVILVEELVDKTSIHSLPYITTISSSKFYDYLRWCIGTWLTNHVLISVFDFGNNIGTFLKESLNFLIQEGHKGLLLPRIKIYAIESETREPLFHQQIEKESVAISTFFSLHKDIKDVNDLMYILPDSDVVYLRDCIGDDNIYWKMNKVKIKAKYLNIDSFVIKKPAETTYVKDLSKLILTTAAATDPVVDKEKCMSDDCVPNEANWQAGLVIVLIFIVIVMFIVIFVILYYVNKKEPIKPSAAPPVIVSPTASKPVLTNVKPLK